MSGSRRYIGGFRNSIVSPPICPPQDLLEMLRRDLVESPANSGILVWQRSSWPRRARIGDRAGHISHTPSNAYRGIHIRWGGRGWHLREHSVIWYLRTGIWPATELDHRDRNGLDNSFTQLRLASRQQQGQNTSIKKSNSSGYIGVDWHRKSQKWRARARDPVTGVRIFLGTFAREELELAARARDAYVRVHYDQ